MNTATIKNNPAPVRGLTREEIQQLDADNWICVCTPQHRDSRSRPLTAAELAEFARKNGLAMFRDGVQIDTPAPFLPPPPPESELVLDETVDAQWFCYLDAEERERDGTPIPLYAEATDPQTVLAINWYSPWDAVYPPGDAEYWLARHIWTAEDISDPNKCMLRYGNTQMTYTAQVQENWHPPYPSTRCTYQVWETYTDFEGVEHDNSCDEIPEFQTEAEAQQKAQSFCEADLADWLNTEDWSPGVFHAGR